MADKIYAVYISNWRKILFSSLLSVASLKRETCLTPLRRALAEPGILSLNFSEVMNEHGSTEGVMRHA
ncbi:hypothetical protein OLZ31_17090 [Enterobacter asburiae]|uniref:hypothetical protein n=1 Tax=Enterobacter genomosp. O TaxID=2364150 RepID=UPI000A4E5471|nr:hypothetical protein [Enterobacter genomosp. O]MCW1828562.1 hypothetical protein [Enterobacter asburiae]